LPPLRERKDDIPLLATLYLEEFNLKCNARVKGMTPELVKKLQEVPWKGNVRELKNVLERMVIMADGEMLSEEDLPIEYQLEVRSTGNMLSLSSVEKNHIQRILLSTKGNKAEAARVLDIGLTTLYRKIDEYHLTGFSL
jgi:DNA-binding NtrC family response regulator